MIDFSIIIPVYNLENCIVKTLDSICKNKLENAEVIIVDDGSTDNTAKIAKSFLDQNEVPHFQVISQENKGVSAARNAGIIKASGKYLIFCDGDDLCEKNLLETIGEYIDKDYDMLVWRYYIQQGDDKRVSQKGFKQDILKNQSILRGFLLEENKIRLGSFAVKKSLIEKETIKFTVDCAIAEDIEFMYKCLAVSKSLYAMDNVLFTYIKRAGSAMNKFDWKRFQAPLAVQRLYTYVRDRMDILIDSDVKDYLHNGLYLLHSMFSFDACIQYLNGYNDAHYFIQKYFTEYSEIEEEIKRAIKEMQIVPTLFSKKRIILFKLSRKLYVYYYVLTSGRK